MTFEKVVFNNNSAVQHDSIFYCDTSQVVYFESAIFSNNRGKEGGAIVSYRSMLYFGKVSFIGNSADNGGAISLKDDSYITIDNATSIYFQKNRAKFYGGGVFVEDKNLWLRKTSQVICFVQLNQTRSAGHLYFTGNKAGLAGNALFGGWIDVCLSREVNSSVSNVFSVQNYNNNILSAFLSNPSHVCICVNNTPSRHSDSISTGDWFIQQSELR